MGKKVEHEIAALDIREQIQEQCGISFGGIEQGFLCKSIGIVGMQTPIIFQENTTLLKVCQTLQAESIGCVLIVDSAGKLSGVFSERDYLTKLFDKDVDLSVTSVAHCMTKNPQAIQPDDSIAYCLTLMAQGGFRHMPIVDEDSCPVGIISVKDIVAALVNSTLESVLSLPLSN